MFCFRSDIGRSVSSSTNTLADSGPVLQSGVELLAADSVISTFRVSSAEPARAPGEPVTAWRHNFTANHRHAPRARINLKQCRSAAPPVPRQQNCRLPADSQTLYSVNNNNPTEQSKFSCRVEIFGEMYNNSKVV